MVVCGVCVCAHVCEYVSLHLCLHGRICACVSVFVHMWTRWCVWVRDQMFAWSISGMVEGAEDAGICPARGDPLVC